MDVFDLMLEKIQQFPLDANLFERNLKRLYKDQEKLKEIFDEVALKLILKKSTKYLRKFKNIKSKLKLCLKKKIEITETYEKKIDELSLYLEKISSGSNLIIGNPLNGSGPSIIKLDEGTSSNNRKYCVCRRRAFGLMICCDKPACKIKWYHFDCSGLNTVPKSEFTCSSCANE